MTEDEFTAHLGTIRQLIRHYAHRLQRTRGVHADDTEQDAILHLWAVREKAAAHPSPSRFMAQAAKWRMLRYTHAERRHRLPALDPAAGIATHDDPPHEFAALVALAPERYHHLLARRFGEGDTLPQIAAALGVTGQTVADRIGRALDHIRAAIA